MSFLRRTYWDRMQFLVDYRDGSVRERVLGTAGTVTGAPQNTRGMVRASTSTQSVHYGAGYNISDWSQPFTLVFDFDYNRLASVALLLNKLSGVNYPGWYLYLIAGWLRFGLGKDGTHYMEFTLNTGLPLPDTHTRIVSIFSFDGTWTTTCMTGITNGVPQSTVSVTGAAPAVDLSNASNLVLLNTTYALKGGIRTIAKFSGVLTPTEQMRLYNELLREQPVVRRPTKHFSLPYPSKTPAEYAAEGALVDLDCSTIVGRKVLNPASLPDVGVVGPVDVSKEGPFDGAIRCSATAYLQQAAMGNVEEDSGTFSFWAARTNGGTVNGYAVQFGNALIDWQTILIRLWPSTSGALGLGTYNWTCPFGKWTYVVVSQTGTDARLYVDGVQVAWSSSTISGAPSIPADTTFQAGVYSGSGSNIAFARAGFKTSIPTPAEVRAEYLEGARKCLVDATVHRDGSCPVNLAAVSVVDNQVSGEWYLGAATPYEMRDKSPVSGAPGERYILKNTGAVQGHVYAKDANPLIGSWYFHVNISPAGGFFNIMLGTSKASRAHATQNGYYLHIATSYVQVYKTTAGVDAGPYVNNTSLSITPECEVWFTRRFDGYTQLWIRSYGTVPWLFVGSFTEATHTSMGYMSVHHSYVGSEVYGGKHFLGEMTPYEAIELGLIEGTIPEPFVFTTTDTTQNWTMRLTSGATYVFDWGDGVQSYHVGNGADQVVTHTYASAGTYTIKLHIDDLTTVRKVYSPASQLSGSLPAMSGMTSIQYAQINLNSLSGSIPNLSSSAALLGFIVSSNALTGTIPSLSANVALQYFYVHTNSLTGYTASTLATSLIDFQAQGNALTQAAVDQVLVDFATNVAARPAVGTINLSGGTNAAPSAVGLAAKAAILAAKPAWTITNN